METKLLEITDKDGTHWVLAIRPDITDEHIRKGLGVHTFVEQIYLVGLNPATPPAFHYTKWDSKKDVRLFLAHQYLLMHWDDFAEVDVLDVDRLIRER